MLGAFALAFTACSSEEEIANVNPYVNGKSVKAEFSLNLPSKVATRQQKAITQDETDFRGIALADLYIAPFATAKQADENPVKATDQVVGEITLTEGIDDFDHETAQDKWYNDVEVPIGTNAFLVYAKATASGSDAENGKLTMSAEKPFEALAELNFELAPIAEDFDIATEGKAITDALTALAATEGVPSAGVAACAWSAVKAEDNQFYAELYANFASLKAGSATDVKAYLEDQLLPAVEAVQNTGDATDGIDVKLAAAIATAIAAIPAEFPGNGIPDGAAVLKCTDGTFSYVADEFITGAKWGANAYTYPAELWYRINTGIRVAEEIKSTEVADQTWNAFVGSAYTRTDNMVKASSQSVALLNPLQYAVANLETQIKFAAENLVVTKTVVTDYTTDPATTTEEEVESVPVKDLALSGILVGDQANVDWQFEPVADADAVVVYDTDLIKTAFNADDYITASQTLLCETHKDVVNVALEFINNTGADFMGIDGIVPAGAKFYLIGQLDKSKATDNGTTADYVLQQDYKTIAKFLIKNLNKTAYNTIPDLRSPELEFGLSVDLEWQDGYEFEITVE